MFLMPVVLLFFFFSSRRRHTRCALVTGSSDVCSSDLENVSIGLGRFRRTGVSGALVRAPRTRAEDAMVDEVAWGALDLTGLTGDAHVRADQLSYGGRRRVEFARALAMRPRFLLLDEPSAGMAAEETAEFVDALRQAFDSMDLTVLVVEQELTFVRAIAPPPPVKIGTATGREKVRT